MKIAFDFNAVTTNRFSGFHSFGMGLLKGFSLLPEKPELLLFCPSRLPQHILEPLADFSEFAKIKQTRIKIRWLENLWQHSNHPNLQRFTGEFDAYHCFHHLMPPTKGKPRILTIHDLRRYKLPHLYEKSKLKLFERAIRLADHYVAVSTATKNDLCEIFDIVPEKVDVVHLAADEGFHPFSIAEKDAAIKRLSSAIGQPLTNYIIAFSSSDKRKNISRITKSFLRAKTKIPSHVKLLIIGALPKDDESLNELIRADGGSNIIALGTVVDIRDLLGCADTLVFASLYEGFGIPILEAFASGVPVITSNCSSMPEVAGNAAILVDPLCEASIAEALQQVCNNSALRENLIIQGSKKLQQFSWAKTAKDTFKVYKKLC